jgi:transcription initiation factor IIE alpha subunit
MKAVDACPSCDACVARMSFNSKEVQELEKRVKGLEDGYDEKKKGEKMDYS